MAGRRISTKRTVFFDEITGDICFCQGDFWKTCSLRVVNDLPCQEAIISITPIDRDGKDPASNATKSLDSRLANLNDQLRNMGGKYRI